MSSLRFFNPQSAIRNPQSVIVCLLQFAIISLAFSPIVHAVNLKVATFKVDVTPPPGSPLCEGLVPPATGVNDPLWARGVILQADDQKPVVLVAVDWVGIANDGLDAWRQALADGCKTPLDRVCVHSLHQHDAPGCDFLAEKIAAEAGLANELFPVEFAREAIKRVGAAAAKTATQLEPVTHVGVGKGVVEKVASNRRMLGPDGNVMYERMSACKDATGQALPEGVIDPNVRMLTFWQKDKPLAVVTYYATHPQSYYYTGLCSADFVGMARDQAEAAEKVPVHVHFNGAGGNIAAGKYNNGSHEMRPVLAGRLAEGMKRAWDDTKKIPVADLTFDWATRDVRLPVGEWYDEQEQTTLLHNEKAKKVPRLNAAGHIAFARHVASGPPITIGRLRLGPIDVLQMPGELFVEYQLAAQLMRPESFVCMAAYGDYGPWYIGTAIAYTQGGYETGNRHVSRVSPRVEFVLMNAMQELLSGGTPAKSAIPTAATANEAKVAFSTPATLTKLLERRWPLAAIEAYCTPERRHNPEYQLLVADSDVVWKDALHANAKSKFDSISWYATTENNRAEQYSIEVRRGNDFWNIEGGTEETVGHAPDVTPDPTKPWFIGKK